MAAIRYLDAQGSTPPLDLVGDSGMLPLSTLMASLANPSSIDADDGTRIRQSIYSGTTLRFRYEFTYATVVTPNVDKIISEINVYGSNNDLLQTWSGISFSLASVIKTGALPVLSGEGRVEGNASANYLQSASSAGGSSEAQVLGCFGA
jgi:hypothetical protein